MNNSDIQSVPVSGSDSSCCPSPDLLLGHADQVLGAAQEAEVSSHLEQCGSCADLVRLMGAADPSPEQQEEDRHLVARTLGFEKKQTLIQRLLGLADCLWQIRTPLLVPVGTSALLFFLLFPGTQPVSVKAVDPAVHHFADCYQMVDTDLNTRSSTPLHVVMGALITFEHDAAKSGLAVGDSVSLTVNRRNGESGLLRSVVDNEGLIKIPFTFLLPGRYRLQLTSKDDNTPLAVVHCTVTSPPPATR